MKWTQSATWKNGDKRTRLGFLWIPRCIGGVWKWLEWAAWTEVRDEHWGNMEDWSFMKWARVEWLNWPLREDV